MLPLVPAQCRRVLDVGCGAGGFGESLKRIREIEVWGIEPVKSAAEQAASKLDYVIHGSFDSESKLAPHTFDCVIFNDVLEHMVTPEQALRYARCLLAPQGVVVASIPNIGNYGTVWQLLYHARWDYTDSGVLDRTHLRFFTKSSIEKMFKSEGYSTKSIHGINAHVNGSTRLKSAYKLVNTLFLGKFSDMKFQQFAVVAELSLPGGQPAPAGQ
jgi:2-polyprenyl-3-methyl-5-hydroxy-6-metoxy-1,4-benzoquinol methylase